MSEPRGEPPDARRSFAAAEELALGSPRETLLSRLTHYRQAAFAGRSLLAPHAPPPGQASAAEAPSVASEDAALDEDGLGKAVADARTEAVEVLRLLDDAATRALELQAHRRVVRGANWFVLGVSVASLIAMGASKVADPPNLAKGKPWRASSNAFDCHPEQIECGGARTSVFFHTTLENEPWVEIDLIQPVKFSAVTVRNRSDGSRDRAVPMVLEVSEDAQTWRVVGERADEFRTWKAKFDPVIARYVRARAKKHTYLHLDAVQVHP